MCAGSRSSITILTGSTGRRRRKCCTGCWGACARGRSFSRSICRIRRAGSGRRSSTTDMVSYRASRGGKVRIVYKMRQDGVDDLGYQSESLTPMYEDIYVKDFILYKGDLVRYYFQETRGKKQITQEENVLGQTRDVPPVGRYGKLTPCPGWSRMRGGRPWRLTSRRSGWRTGSLRSHKEEYIRERRKHSRN